MPAPKFSQSLADAIRLSADSRGAFAFLPWWLATCVAVPILAFWKFGAAWQLSSDPAALVAIFAAYAVVGGFLGSVSVATIAQIQHTASQYPFSDYLKKEGLLELFLFMPQLIFTIQLVFIVVSTISAVLALSQPFRYLGIEALYVETGLLIYVSTKTWGLLDLVRKLMWHYQEYTTLLKHQ